jgi:hypothetical protein
MVYFAGFASSDGSAISIIPHEGVADPAAMIRLADLRDQLLPLIGSTYVIVILDACPGGPASMVKQLDALGMTVAVGAKPGTMCYEQPDLSHGAFTAALLQGVAGGADRDKDGAIWVSELMSYVEAEVPAITKGRQVPESTIGFDGPILAVDPTARQSIKAAAQSPSPGTGPSPEP